jgi:hypothetical protein
MSDERKTWLAQIEDGSMQARVVEYYTQQPGTHKTKMADALMTAAAQNADANCWITQLLVRIKALEAELEMQRADEPVALAQEDAVAAVKFWQMSDPPQSDNQGGEGATPKGPVDTVIDLLNKRLVPRSDRIRLRGAVDVADAPQTGRAGADEALGRVTRFVPPQDALGWWR